MQSQKEITFGRFRLDLTNECLWRGTRSISLRPKAYAVLRLLVEHPGQLVNKQQVFDAVWPGTFVGDEVLKDNIRQLREALGDDAGSPTYIETAHRRGYRFIGKISEQIGRASSRCCSGKRYCSAARRWCCTHWVCWPHSTSSSCSTKSRRCSGSSELSTRPTAGRCRAGFRAGDAARMATATRVAYRTFDNTTGEDMTWQTSPSRRRPHTSR